MEEVENPFNVGGLNHVVRKELHNAKDYAIYLVCKFDATLSSLTDT